MSNKLPGAPSAHEDGFTRKNLPDPSLWPVFDYAGVPELAGIPDHLNAATALLDDNVAAFGDRPVVHMGSVSWTYNDLLARANQIAHVLVEDCGLKSGQRVLLRAPNTPMMVACWFGVLKAGGVCIATMPLLRARELVYILEKAEITHALCDVALAEEMETAKAQAPVLQHLLFHSVLGTGEDAATLETAAADKPLDFENIETAADDVALIAFTSGTTGSPKGTMHFHRDLLASCECFPRYVGKLTPDDVVTGTPPLAFTFGLGGLVLFPMRFGASTRFLEDPSPDGMLQAIQDHGITQMYTAPTAYRAIAGLADKYDTSSLRQGISAGETLPKATWEAFHAATGIRLIDGLGATELLHIFVAAPPEDMRAGYTGVAIPGYQARVVDEDGNEVTPGTPGQLAVRGPTGCRYLDDEDRQQIYVRDGWNYPGDIYEMSEEGYFRYVARADDMIISAGYNISGPEVEAAILEHANVAECAVVAKPDLKRTNIVKAFVVLRDSAGAGDEAVKELQNFVKAEIAPYKYPREIEFVESLPKTQTGKLQRFRLRETK